MPATNDCASIGFIRSIRPHAHIDPELAKRALLLAKWTHGLIGVAKVEGIIAAIDELYFDLPQSWLAWDSAEAMESRPEEPDDLQIFHPGDRVQLGRWLCDCIDRKRTAVFVVPLDGFINDMAACVELDALPKTGDKFVPGNVLAALEAFQ